MPNLRNVKQSRHTWNSLSQNVPECSMFHVGQILKISSKSVHFPIMLLTDRQRWKHYLHYSFGWGTKSLRTFCQGLFNTVLMWQVNEPQESMVQCCCGRWMRLRVHGMIQCCCVRQLRRRVDGTMQCCCDRWMRLRVHGTIRCCCVKWMRLRVHGTTQCCCGRCMRLRVHGMIQCCCVRQLRHKVDGTIQSCCGRWMDAGCIVENGVAAMNGVSVGLHWLVLFVSSVLPKLFMAPVRMPILRRFGQVTHTIHVW